MKSSTVTIEHEEGAQLGGHGARYWFARGLGILMGLMLLGAASTKVSDLGLFIRQIKDYDIITNHLAVTWAAWGMVGIECALGVALCSGVRLRVTLGLGFALFAVFFGATLWAWYSGAAEDCGCFGAWLERTPGEAAASNAVVLVLTAVAWRLAGEGGGRDAVRVGLSLAAGGLGLLMPFLLGFPISSLWTTASRGDEIGPVRLLEPAEVDLGRGTLLLALLDTECEHCRESVEPLNRLVEQQEMIEIAALCLNEAEQRDAFVLEFGPVFPMTRIEEADFWRLLGPGVTPRFLLVRDGRLLRSWEVVPPDLDALFLELPDD